ncbi:MULTISPECIES: DUF2007 domain-containing protein [Sphingobacterium]|jgi:hypothetical protein|uniref:DUF2007 domain-containing protein n=2 Tax=Sphingobacterium TaxID=28453 RepID=A0ABW5Z0F9_9SPHI|nr:DUF2007 domain-containing protein [Sphingobacterium sp. UDSM-2020]QQD15185.1 DUF2007 domain-containing protein [Sphingobacterium sp. UDSM-2020]
MEQGWKKIKVYTNAIEAEIVKQMLEESGIPAIVLNKQDSSYLVFGKIELYVNQEDEQQALVLIESTTESED